MREVFAREFPEAGRVFSRTRARFGARRPIMASEPALWATTSGIGAGFLIGSIVQALVGLTSEAIEALRAPMPFALFPLVTIAGGAAAAAVALRGGGPIALALYAGYVALGVALAIPGVMTFCERSGGVGFPLLPGPGQCTALGFLASLWPQLVGIGLGVALTRVITTRGNGINSLLRIAGGYAVAQFVLSQLWGATVAQGGSALSSGLTLAAVMAAAAVAAGVIAAQLPRGIRNAAIVAGIWLLPWLTFQLPSVLRTPASTVPAEHVGPMLISIAVQPMGAAFLVLSAAIAARSRFIPRDTA